MKDLMNTNNPVITVTIGGKAQPPPPPAVTLYEAVGGNWITGGAFLCLHEDGAVRALMFDAKSRLRYDCHFKDDAEHFDTLTDGWEGGTAAFPAINEEVTKHRQIQPISRLYRGRVEHLNDAQTDESRAYAGQPSLASFGDA